MLDQATIGVYFNFCDMNPQGNGAASKQKFAYEIAFFVHELESHSCEW